MERVVLGIDTATREASIALAGPATAAVKRLPEGAWQARELLSAIEILLREAGLAKGDIGGIGVAAGPGSFTGVRIGLATAKGLGFALDIPVEGISTLEAMARAVAPALGGRAAVICAALGAGRGEVYGALFTAGAAGIARLSPDAAWRPEELAKRLPPGAVTAGDGSTALRAAGVCSASLEVPPLAPAIAARVWELIPAGTGYRAGGPGPNYVRPADAEASRKRP